MNEVLKNISALLPLTSKIKEKLVSVGQLTVTLQMKMEKYTQAIFSSFFARRWASTTWTPAHRPVLFLPEDAPFDDAEFASQVAAGIFNTEEDDLLEGMYEGFDFEEEEEGEEEKGEGKKKKRKKNFRDYCRPKSRRI